MIWLAPLLALLPEPLKELLTRCVKRSLPLPEEEKLNLENQEEKEKREAEAAWDEAKEDFDRWRLGK
jgi:hypothetical protein